MRSLYCCVLLSCWLWQQCGARSLLVLGDSVDRHMTEDWCQLRTGLEPSRCGAEGSDAVCSHWLRSVFTEEVYPASMTSMQCNDSAAGDSISFVHLYGSPDSGPYFKFGSRNSSNITLSNDNYTASPARIAITLKSYFRLVGLLPDLVVLNSALWDISRAYEAHGLANSTLRVTDPGYLTRHGDLDKMYSSSYNATCASFERNMRRRIRDVEKGLALQMGLPHAEAGKADETSLRRVRDRIALRTSVWTSASNVLTHAFNGITRSLSSELQLSLYDYDRDLWRGRGYNTSLEKELLRDFVHPLKHYTAQAGEKMLMYTYSSLFFRRCSEECLAAQPRPWWRGSSIAKPAVLMRVHAVAEQPGDAKEAFTIDPRKSFYVRSHEKSREVLQRFSGVNERFLRAMQLGPSDILYLAGARLATISRGPPLPRELASGSRSGLAEAVHSWADQPHFNRTRRENAATQHELRREGGKLISRVKRMNSTENI